MSEIFFSPTHNRGSKSVTEWVMITYTGLESGCYYFKFSDYATAKTNLKRLGMKLSMSGTTLTITLTL